jgi:hypothetical protein
VAKDFAGPLQSTGFDSGFLPQEHKKPRAVRITKILFIKRDLPLRLTGAPDRTTILNIVFKI